jgi:hypothetical protein
MPARAIRRIVRIASIGIAALAFVLGGLATAPIASAGGGSPDSADAAAFVAAINALRSANGRDRLTVSSALSQVATGWAEQMARSNVLSHNPSLGAQVHGWHYLAENVGVGPTVASVRDAFAASPPHRANMLDPRYTLIGVGAVPVAGKVWIVEDFEAPWTSKTSTVRSTSRPSHAVVQRSRAQASVARQPAPLRHKAVRGVRPTAVTRPSAAACEAGRFFAARRHLKYTWTGPRDGPSSALCAWGADSPTSPVTSANAPV